MGAGAGGLGSYCVFCVSEDQGNGRSLATEAPRALLRVRHEFSKLHKSGEEVKQAIIKSGEREGPGIAAAQADRWVRKGNFRKRAIVGMAAKNTREFRAHPGGGGHAMPGEAERKVHIVQLAGMWHYVKGKIEGAAPGIVDFRIAQLRIDADHALTQEFRAFPHGTFGLREKRGTASEEHAVVG